MTGDHLNKPACRSEEIVAYLDGDMDARAHDGMERHFAECARCAAELKAQRRLLRELDFVLADDDGVELPANFAQVVARRAQSDMSGVREKGERRRALSLCAALALISFALLGGARLRESVFAPLRAVWKAGTALFSFIGHALYDAGAGLAVVTRGVSWHLLFESRSLGLLMLLLFASALFLLSRMISGYHRTVGHRTN